MSITSPGAAAEEVVAPVLDSLHNSSTKIPNTDVVYPASEYTLTEFIPQDVNNLPLNVVKYYDPNTLDNSVHFLEIGFKHPVYGEGDSSKYFKWAKDGDSVKLVETSVESEAVLTIKYNAGDTINTYNPGDGQSVDSVSEIYIGKDLKGIIGGVGNIGNISSKFVGNTTKIDSVASDGFKYSAILTGNGGEIDSLSSSFIGNTINMEAGGNLVDGAMIQVLGNGTIGNLDSEFIGNNIISTSDGTVLRGGLISNASDGVIGNMTSDFIRNTVSIATTNTKTGLYGAIIHNAGTSNISSSKFIENRGVSANGILHGGAIYNATTGKDKLIITDTVFEGNSLKSGSTTYGGAIYNTGTLNITNSIFKDNYVVGSTAKGGAIYTTQDMTISANGGKTTEFSGNYTLNGSTRDNQAVYVNNDNATVTFSATDGGTILLNDKIDGTSGYNVVLGGDTTGTIGLYNSITNANIRANGVNIDMSDNVFKTYDFLSLASDNTANFSLDVSFKDNSADKFTLGSESRGTIFINDLNILGGVPTTSQVIQLLTGPDTISVGLSQDLIDKYHKITINDRGESDELTSTANWGDVFGAHLYKDTIEEGIRTATTGAGRTTADSLEYYVNKTTEDLGVVSGGDTMMLLNQTDKFSEKTFTAKSSSDTYTLGANLGATSGTFNVNGYSSSYKNILDANGHTMFEIGDGATVNLKYLTINNLADEDGSLMRISEGGTGSLYHVNVNGNENTAAIVNDGSLTLSGGSSSAHNTITGGGIKGSGTTTIYSSSYWDISASGLQNTINNGNLYLNSGTLNALVSGIGKTYINDNQAVTTNADNLRIDVYSKGDNCRTSGAVLNLTGGEINSKIYSVTMNITGDVTVGDKGQIGYSSSSSYYTDINISEGASLTTDASKFKHYRSSYTKLTNDGDLNLTGGTFSYKNGAIYGSGTTNILGDVTLYGDSSSYVYNNIHVKDGILTISASSIKNNVVNDSILKLVGGTIAQNILPDLNGTGKTQIASSVTAYYTNFNQDVEILNGGSLRTNWNRNFTNIKNNSTLYVTNEDSTSNRTSSSNHGVWSQYVSGEGTIIFYSAYSYYLYIDNEVQLDNKVTISNYARVWSDADLLGNDVTINPGYGSLYLTGGTINHKISGDSGSLYIDTGANVIGNALITSTNTGTFLTLNNNSTLTISADNLDADTTLYKDSNLKLKSGTWDNRVQSYSNTCGGTVTILSGEEVKHATVGDASAAISSAVVIENDAKFTASASNLKDTVTNDGSLYLSGLLNRKYNGTGITYIDDTLHVSSGAGFPATFDLNNGHLISDSIATYTFGHTTNNGGLTFNVNAAGTNSDLFNLASTSNAVFDIKDVVFGTYKTPSFANTVKTYQILKGSPSYLTLDETIQKDIHIYDNVRDQLGVNIYQDDPENRYFDDEYLDRITEGDVGATIELATTESNHDSVKITYGDYVDASHSDRIDLLSDWNKLKTSNVRNFNFRTADDVYTSLVDVGVTTAGTLNINGVSTTTTDADGNTVIKRSVIDLAGHSGFNMSNSTKNVINLSNVEFRNANRGGEGGVFATNSDTFGTILDDGTIQGGIVNCLFKDNKVYRLSTYGSASGGAIALGSGTIMHQILNSTFEGNSSSSYGGAVDNGGTISSISGSAFENNSAFYGGAIYNGNNINIINNCLFKNNASSSKIGGGAIRNKGIIGNIINSSFYNNHDDGSSYSGGGAIANYNGTIDNLINCTFSNNYINSSSKYSGKGGAIYNYKGTINNIVGSTFENNSAQEGSAIYNYKGTINEILNCTFKNNDGTDIYNVGKIKISARNLIDENGDVIQGITEFSNDLKDNHTAIVNTYDSNFYNKSPILILNAENNGLILINHKIKNSSSSYIGIMNITGDSTGTIKLFDTVEGGTITADSVNINTANSKTQNYTFTNFISDESAKWTIDVDFANKTADKFTVGNGTGTMYIDNLNVLGNAEEYTKVTVLNKTKDSVAVDGVDTATTGLALKDAVVDVRDTLGDTTYNDQTYHQEAGFAVASSKTWNSTNTYLNDQISQCIDEELDALNLITSSNKHEVRNFVFRDGSIYTLSQDLDNMYKGTLNITGVEGAGSTIDANGHKLFKCNVVAGRYEYILNLSDVKLTGADTLIKGNRSDWKPVVNISGKETILDGNVYYTDATLNSGNLRIANDTFKDTYSSLRINDGTLALNNGGTETYNIYSLTPGDKGKLAIDIDLNSKVSDQLSLNTSSGVITVSSVDFINGIPENGSFVVQVIQNSSNSTLQLALDDSIKHYVFDEYSAVMADEIQIDTDFGHTYYNRLYTGSAYGDLSLATTSKTNDSIAIDIKAEWNDNPEIVDSMGDTLYLINGAELTTRNFNAHSASDVHNVSANLDKTAQGTLNLNGVLDSSSDNRTTINFKNHKAFQIGDNTNLIINNTRLTGARDLINVDSASANLTLNNAYINGSILGSAQYNMLIDGNETTTILGTVTNANTILRNGGLVISENTFADASNSIFVDENAYVHLNDGDISNYKISNINSSNLSKFGLDLNLETRQADMITAEGSGRIVFEKFDIVNNKLSNVDIGEDYTIRILYTSNDSLQLAISKTVQQQLEKEYLLGTVHEITRMDSVVPVADWGTQWEIAEADIDVYGKLKLATTVTTNDSLHLYELRKDPHESVGNLGDTLMLMSILETDEDRRFYTKSADSVYDLSVDIGEVTSGKMAIEGTADGDNLSTLNMNAHKGFKLSNETEMSVSNVEIINAGYKDGSLFDISNENSVLNLANVTIKETTSTNAIKNSGTVNMTGGNVLLYSGITGTGVTNITNGANVTLTEGLAFTQKEVNVNNGYLLIEKDSLIESKLFIGTPGLVETSPESLTTATVNDGELRFADGTVTHDVTGNGTTTIYGNVINEATIAQNVNVISGEFTTSADNIGGVIYNKAITNLTGTLKNTVLATGTTNVNKTLTLAQGAGIEGTLNLNDGIISTTDNLVSTYQIGTMLNEGTFDIDIDLSSKTSDLFNVGNDSEGLVYIETINFMNSTSLNEGESFTIQVLETNGTDAIQIALNEELKAERIAVGTVSDLENDLKAVVNFNEKFHDRGRVGTIYATLSEATVKTTNDGIKLTYSGIEWGEPGESERVDTLKELNQYSTDEEKEFNFTTSTDKYTVAEDLGKATEGTLNINGVADEDGNKSKIDINDHSGFELTENTTLNIKDTEIGGAKDDKIIVSTNPDAVINIENGTLNGDIDGTDTQINISGDDTDTTILNGDITDSDTTLDGGTLKFNPNTFGDENDTLTINNGRIDVQDDKVDTYEINKLTSSEEGRYSIDVDLDTETADKIEVTDATSSGTVYIDDINYINDDLLPKEFKAQILETNGNDDIQIKLSDEIKKQTYDLRNVEDNWDDLKANVDFDEFFHDFHKDGVVKGKITEATTKTTNDSIALTETETIWGEVETTARIDTLHEISVYETDEDKTFNFKSATDNYGSKVDVGKVNGTLSVNGVSDGESRSTIDLSAKSGFEIGTNTTLNLNDVEIGKGKNNTLISAIESGSTVNIENNVLNGNIIGKDTTINITGEDTDKTVLNGRITGSDTTFDGGTLQFNTDTFADKDDTLTVNSGRVDVKDSKVDTYDVTKLTSAEEGKYSIDIDLSTETADKFNLTDTTSSGTVYIDDINYLNGGDKSKEFSAQVLDTKGNNNIQIKLSDEIKKQTYDLGKTEKNWNDLKADINFDEFFHDYHQDGTFIGQITEDTKVTTNDSIALKITGTEWEEAVATERIDTLHEISGYDEADDKTFNFKTSSDEYHSKTDVGVVNNTLTVNGVADEAGNKSKINLEEKSGFELVTDSTLNLNDVEVDNGSNNNIITATQTGARINVENGTLNGNINGNETKINITGDATDKTILNGEISNSDTTLSGGTLSFNTNTFGDKDDTLTITKGRVDVKDSKVDTYDINKLTSSEDGKYSIDVDLKAETSDKFNLTDTTSSGTVYIDDINYLNSGDPKEFVAQILDTKGNDDIQIKLSDAIKSEIYTLGNVEDNWDDLKASVDFDELFHDYHKDGVLKGKITEATTETTNDSIALKVTETIWGEVSTTARIDTLHEISAYETEEDKNFNFKTAADKYGSKTDVGEVKGTLSINGVSDGESRSTIDLNAKSGFEIGSDTILNLTDVEIGKGKNNTIISAIESGSTVNIENNLINGNINGKDTQININGDVNDTTVLNGVVTDSDTTLNGGTLKFGTDTFADNSDTLTVEGGRIDVKDSKVDTYDITKLTSSENGKYSIDLDLSTQTADKFDIKDSNSSGKVYIDDIKYLNGDLPKEFIAQILDTKGNDKIQIVLSDDIKKTIYDFGKTEKNWNDLKADVDFDEFFHDFRQEGDIKGSIKEATTSTTNDSIQLKMDSVEWGEVESTARIDTLHEISAYNEAESKTFNFKSATDEYESKADVGTVNGKLSIEGIKTSNKLSKINLKNFKGFELIKDSKLEVNNTRLSNGADNVLITATDESAEVTLNNAAVDGDITGVENYTVNLTGDESHVFDVRHNIENATINIDTIRLDVYNTNSFSSSDVSMHSGILNMTSDRIVSDLSSTSFHIAGSFGMLADADLRNQVMDKLPSHTTIADGATLNVAGINLLSDTTAMSVAIPFAYKGFKDNVRYTGSSELSKETQLTTAYAPIYKYDIRYDNRDDMGYFVFSRSGLGGGNGSSQYNPAVLASPVATQAAGQSAMNETFRYVFEHADAFTQLPSFDRLSIIKSNEYALSTDFNHNLGSLCHEHNNKAGWYRPYSTFESLDLSNGPKVSTISYGSLAGYDTDFRDLGHGWHNVGTGYIGYTGSQLHYSGVDTTMNGGLLGLTETFYKGNFWTALTATAGAGVAETRTMYGKEDSTMLMAGIGSKTGYNVEFKSGKYILQPIMFMSYTFVNTFDYTNAAGLRINNKPMHTIQLNPSVRFIANLKGGWQPYASVGMVWNLMNESSSSANGVRLPEMHTKPYVEYGLGLQKNMKDRFTAFGQAMVRNGGRTGIALTAGFRWALGHDHDHDHDHERVQVDTPMHTSHSTKTILKQLTPVQKSALRGKKDTTITSTGAVIKEL